MSRQSTVSVPNVIQLRLRAQSHSLIGSAMSRLSEVARLLSLLLSLTTVTEANLRCYSCAPCNEFELFAGDTRHFEADCYLDRYCMKITGRNRDIFGYESQVSVRGCPLLSLFTNLEEGCSDTSLQVGGVGLVEGTVCLCSTPLCNDSDTNAGDLYALVFVVANAILAFIVGF